MERKPLTPVEYEKLKHLVIKSAHDFLWLYESIIDKDITCLKERKSFYGLIPRTAKAMYKMASRIWGIENIDNPFYFGN